ncbi:hypothetical protein HB375_07220 [Microvirga sp. c23x22]|uniref:Uncharacterized protein n=2 Tax=Microvirga terricola TaxID=2719797 RepID=A0ABX0V9L8_9HYPH|nr:hypothetical protein [Microvirga terricola]
MLSEEYAREVRAAKEAGTWISPWVSNGRAHCPPVATPSGSLEERSNWISRSLETVSLFAHDQPVGMAKTRIELACGYNDGYERILELPVICRFADTALPVRRISETIPKLKNGSLIVCDRKSKSSDECAVHCEEPAGAQPR